MQESIYGFEINPFACHLAETNLLFQVIDLIKEAKKENSEFEMGRFNVFETDSLRIPKKEKPELFKVYNSEWFEDAETVRQIKVKEGKFKHGFDFVVGNPPYVRADSGDVFLKMRKEIEGQNFFKTLYEKWDIYIPFIELGPEFDSAICKCLYSNILKNELHYTPFLFKERILLLRKHLW